MAQNNILMTEITSPKNVKEELMPMLEIPKEPMPRITFLNLFHETSRLEKFCMIIGICLASASGCGLPLFALVFGNLANSLGEKNSDIVSVAATQSLFFVYIGIGVFCCLSLAMSIYLSLCEKVSCRIRKRYFANLLKQEIGWFDVLNPNEIAGRFALDSQTIQKGIGENVPIFFMSIATVIAGFVMGFSRGWQLALVLLGALPFLFIGGSLFALVLGKMKKLSDITYVHAGGMAEQSLNAIKTVKALAGEDFELNNFKKELTKAVRVIKKFGLFAGTSIGFLFFIFLSDHGLGFWFGSILVEKGWINQVADRPYNLGDVLTVFIAITMGSMTFAQVPPPVNSFIQAKNSGEYVFYVANRKPKIPINDKTKKPCPEFSNEILLKNIDFTYPARPDQKVLKNININIQKNKKTAFVGESGSGKSTIVALIERFYDPDEGGIYLDGVDIRDFNLQSLRKKIGYVGQEPVLYSGSIRENLMYGKDDATENEMYEALKKAKAYDFVMNLEKKLDTFVGVGGNQLSGGQKQRLAIARAILKNPPILLLDEATSALDRTNELAIQKTLDDISGGRTTIVIAHRLSTIQDADRIYVMSNGVIDDFGTHEELLSRHGKYEALIKIQLSQNDEEEEKKKKETKRNFKGPSLTNLNEDMHKSVTVDQKHLKSEVEILKKTGELKKKTKRVFKRLFTDYILPNYYLSFVAYTFSFIAGGIQPLMAILFGNVLKYLALIPFPEYKEDSRKNIDLYSGMFLVLGFGALITHAGSSTCFSILGEKVSLDLKTQTYDKILRTKMAFFDDPVNNPGILSTRISIETQNINRLMNSFFGVLFNGIGAFTVGIILSFIYSWQIALLALGLSPILVTGQILRGKVMAGFAKNDEAYNEAGAVVMECTLNMRTVASFCNEEIFTRKYNEKIQKTMKESNRKGIIAGVTFGFCQFLMFGFFAVVFYVAAVLQDRTGLSLQGFFISLIAIMQAASTTGMTANFLPDVGEAVLSAEKVFQILDSKDSENYTKPADLKNHEFKGEISIKNIYFKYPTAEKYLFENFSLEIPAGKKVAFVGPSGCGKSTLFQLLLGFYPFEKGEISIDGIDIREMDVKQLRAIYGVVQQEPVLFQGTVAYNIKYNTDATISEIRKAAEQANALKFIEANEFDVIVVDKKTAKNVSGTGFDRQVGSKGNQISGGQKQRLAIARAIIKNPKILLLDEATSALDAQNEAVVQESLNNIMIGKTTLAIAHRISTIRDYDDILVFGEGKIVERGRYDELVAKQGIFYKFERGFS